MKRNENITLKSTDSRFTVLRKYLYFGNSGGANPSEEWIH